MAGDIERIRRVLLRARCGGLLMPYRPVEIPPDVRGRLDLLHRLLVLTRDSDLLRGRSQDPMLLEIKERLGCAVEDIAEARKNLGTTRLPDEPGPR